jgi:hypothetical protein
MADLRLDWGRISWIASGSIDVEGIVGEPKIVVRNIALPRRRWQLKCLGRSPHGAVV